MAYGDFGNMNGQYFPPHTSHLDGLDVDTAWLDGASAHFAVNRMTAERLIALFQSAAAVPIDFVYVTFDVGSEFWQTIRNAEVNGVRLIPEAVAVNAETTPTDKRFWLARRQGKIRYREGHATHFHIRWKRQ